MATGTQSMNMLHAAFLLIGQPATTLQQAYDIIKSVYCPHKNPSCFCITCISINEGRHFSQVTIAPEKRYTLDDLETIFQKTSWSLEKDEHCFFIIHKADTMSAACANSLLKLVEEPPQGYHFIFLAERLLGVLPTIRSRTIIKTFHTTSTSIDSSILKHFTALTPNPLNFYKDLQDNAPSEDETMLLIDAFIAQNTQLYVSLIQEENYKAAFVCYKRLELLKKSFHTTPMPGSAKLFWKNLYLKYFQCF